MSNRQEQTNASAAAIILGFAGVRLAGLHAFARNTCLIFIEVAIPIFIPNRGRTKAPIVQGTVRSARAGTCINSDILVKGFVRNFANLRFWFRKFPLCALASTPPGKPHEADHPQYDHDSKAAHYAHLFAVLPITALHSIHTPKIFQHQASITTTFHNLRSIAFVLVGMLAVFMPAWSLANSDAGGVSLPPSTRLVFPYLRDRIFDPDALYQWADPLAAITGVTPAEHPVSREQQPVTVPVRTKMAERPRFYQVRLDAGSLKNNLSRIVEDYGYTLGRWPFGTAKQEFDWEIPKSYSYKTEHDLESVLMSIQHNYHLRARINELDETVDFQASTAGEARP